ncbi:UBL fusion protein SDE2 isoform X1 [Hydra vulgaris]|uniref:UBL fusion protein SDE2 isoform X1 n=1 Tax=Hydra vulgaris TaxID=6087 RepID=UPI001F5F694D|nr:replication stress response regulator SDE2 isoform X1 [Hydra vulgaris]
MVIITCKKSWSSTCLTMECGFSARKIYEMIANSEGIPTSNFYLVSNRKVLNFTDEIICDSYVNAYIRVPGGKGGFGSMLRAIGARIEKTTNHEACRDLSGRRMRDVNNEKQIGEWLKKKQDKEDERAKAREEKLKRLLNPVYNYVDQGYTTKLQDNASNVDEAFKAALSKKKKMKSRTNHVSEEDDAPSNKKSCLWIGVSDEESDMEHSDESSPGEHSPGNLVLRNDETSEVPAYTKNVESVMEHSGECNNGNLMLKNDESSEVRSYSKNVEIDMEHSGMSNHENLVMKKNDSFEVPTSSPEVIENSLSSKVIEVSSTNEIKNKKENNLKAIPEPTSENLRVSSHKNLFIEPIDLSKYSSAEELEELGLDRLKFALQALGMKCGGTLQDRAKRLFITKQTPIDQIDPSLFVKKKAGNKS